MWVRACRINALLPHLTRGRSSYEVKLRPSTTLRRYGLRIGRLGDQRGLEHNQGQGHWRRVEGPQGWRRQVQASRSEAESGVETRPELL